MMRKRSSRLFEQNRRTSANRKNVRRNKFASRFVKAEEADFEDLDSNEEDHVESFDEDFSDFEDLDLDDFEDEEMDSASYYEDEDDVPSDYDGELDDIGTSPLEMPEVDMVDTEDEMDPLTTASRNIRKLAKALNILSEQVDYLQQQRNKAAMQKNKKAMRINKPSRRFNRKVR